MLELDFEVHAIATAIDMSSSVFNQGSANGKLATSTSDSDADKNSIHDETFAEDEDLDDAEGLFGSDEEEEEAQYNATLSASL